MHLVMFDIDGTLVDSMGFDTELFASAIEAELGGTIERDWGSYEHVSDSGILEQLVREAGRALDHAEIVSRVQRRFVSAVRDALRRDPSRLREIEGARRLVERLLALPEVRVAIATGGWASRIPWRMRTCATPRTSWSTCWDEERGMTHRSSWVATLVGAAAACGALEAHAHHSVSAWFDTTAMSEVEGVVTDFRWQNPHVVFTLRVPTDRGEALWEIETLSISGISRWGLTQDLFKVGDRLRVAGNPARRGENNIFVRNILLPAGREIVLGGAARWSTDTLRGSELLQARDGDGSRPELGLFRTWSTGAVNGVLFPEAVQANFDFARYPLTQAARAALQSFDFAADDPTVDCTPKGMPTIMEQPYPMEIVDRGDTIELLIEEYDTRRVVHMRGAGVAAAAAAPAGPLGYSVGRLEGATLVVTTTKSSWGHFDSVGIPLSDAAVLEERFTPSADGARLDYVLEVTDAATFTAPVELTKSWIWRPEITRGTYECKRVTAARN